MYYFSIFIGLLSLFNLLFFPWALQEVIWSKVQMVSTHPNWYIMRQWAVEEDISHFIGKREEWNASSLLCSRETNYSHFILEMKVERTTLVYREVSASFVWRFITSSRKDHVLSRRAAETKSSNYPGKLKCQSSFSISSSRNWISDILP